MVDDDDLRKAAMRKRRTINVALVGNPNCGKTSLFNFASGAHERVGNYSGVTVDAKEGRAFFEGYEFNLVDLPGTYSLTAKGAYIVAGSDANPDVVLIASGSEVSTLVAGAELLRKDGVKVRIVSAPSEGLFRTQSKEYQESVIPANAK